MLSKRGQIALRFSGWTNAEARQLRAQLAEIAAGHGYTTTTGSDAGGGHLSEWLVAINGGEIALLLLSDEQRVALVQWIDSVALLVAADHLVRDALRSVRGAIVDAVAREYPDGDPWGLTEGE